MEIRKRKRNNPVVVLLLAALALTSCDFSTVYHSYRHVPLKGWQKQDTLHYELDSIPASGNYRFFIEVRNNARYPYRNLYLLARHNLPDTCTFRTDTIECILIDEKGKWTGTGWGTLYQSSFPAGDYEIEHKKGFKIEIIHGMKDDILPGIEDVGIQVKRF